jgi:branched-chain amino acid transport system permease protein
LISGGIGSFLSVISSRRRLSIILVAVFTMAFQIIFGEVIVGLRNITGGDEGLVLQHDIIQGTITMNRELTYYYIFVIILFAAILIYSKLINSHIGVAFKCITEDETAAAFVGINVVKYKVLSAFFGSFLLGLIGGVYAYYNRYIGPSMFNLSSIDTVVLVMLVFGGMGTLLGPLLGAGIFALIFEFLRPLGQITTLTFGILLIILFVYFREGLVSWLRKLPALYRRL